MIFVDTSGILAMMDGDDRYHPQARPAWKSLMAGSEPLVTTNYVVVESFALLQRRLGLEAAQAFELEVVPPLAVHWVDQELHRAGVAAVLAARRRNLSLVDSVSLEAMGRLGIKRFFGYDAHFEESGHQPV